MAQKGGKAGGKKRFSNTLKRGVGSVWEKRDKKRSRKGEKDKEG
jgi:hypothetical protein